MTFRDSIVYFVTLLLLNTENLGVMIIMSKKENRRAVAVTPLPWRFFICQLSGSAHSTSGIVFFGVEHSPFRSPMVATGGLYGAGGTALL